MTDYEMLAMFHRQNLEEEIIEVLSVRAGISIYAAMDIYYKSDLAGLIESGKYGMDNLDAKYLVEDLIENEPELFAA